MLRRLLTWVAASAVAASVLVAAQAPPATAQSSSAVQCYGDSIIFHMCGTAPPAPLQQELPAGLDVVNFAVGSHRSYAIAVKMGAYRLSTARALTIPASGAVEIGAPGGLPVSVERFDRLTMRSSIAGVEGVLLRGTGGAEWRFVRASAGSATTVPAGTAIVSLEVPQPGAVSIISPGVNNVLEVDQVLRDTAAMVAAHRATSSAPYWVATLSPAWGGTSSQYGAARVRINAAIRATYGDHVAPFGEYLLNGALADAGIFPTPTDRQRIAAGMTPTSFQLTDGDWTHHNPAGRQIGARFLAGFASGATTTDAAYARFDASASLTATVRNDTITLSGWAFDGSDVYQQVAVAMSANGVHRDTVRASGPSPSLAPYGVPGAHGFSWSIVASNGPHRVCATALGFAAGEDSLPQCAVVRVERLAVPARIAGSDRYDTAARLSSRHYPGGAEEVYIASGQVFADAPSAAAAAAHVEAPLLLTQRDALPAATAAELRRLAPRSIVLVGGTPTVSVAVEQQLAQFAAVTRIQGADRYETSARIAEHAFRGATQALVATGRNFPDALAAGPLAASRDAPVLLVHGDRQPPASTLSALGSLGVQHITVVGGTPSVDDLTAARLDDGRTIDRIAGANRYETAVRLSQELAAPSDSVYVASGELFPDALAASAVAGSEAIPLLLAPRSCVHAIVIDEIERLERPDVTLVGGTPTLSERVARYQTC